MKKNNIIKDWLDQHGDLEIERFVEKNLQITEKVRLALETKGWSMLQLAEAMGKSPSEVSKWLSGIHNLTLKSIVKMELALGIDLTHNEPLKAYQYVYLGKIENQSELAAVDYQNNSESQQYAIAM